MREVLELKGNICVKDFFKEDKSWKNQPCVMFSHCSLGKNTPGGELRLSILLR